MKRLKRGSFTIEAAVIIPFVLMLTAGVLRGGISLYQESAGHETLEKLQKWDSVNYFYQIQKIKELGEEGTDDK